MTYKQWLTEFKVIVRARDSSPPDRLKRLNRLLRGTRAAARAGVTDWQEGEVLGFRAVLLEESGDLPRATRAYLRLADVYRAHLAQYAHALAGALETAAATALQTGDRRTAKRVSGEVLRLRAQFPYYGPSLAAMMQALCEEQTERSRQARERRNAERSRKRRRTRA
jgi:HPt (histidine-containing phosphotransfer) domain-containing protein